MKGSLETCDAYDMLYTDSLLNKLSSHELEERTEALYKECIVVPPINERSETKFLQTISQWQTEEKCSEEELRIILGWYLDDEMDESWKKVDKVFSQKQKEFISFPSWIDNGTPFSVFDDEAPRHQPEAWRWKEED